MSIVALVLNVADVNRSVDFYTRQLQARLVGSVSNQGAVLDLGTAMIEVTALRPGATASTWAPDDLQRGFRHIGFKVDHVDRYVAQLKAAGVPFHLEPIEAEGNVRITFFRDPDGTLLELVERDLQYTRVLDVSGVAAERSLGRPTRPRFDHVALTVSDLDATVARYAPLGFSPIGTIAQPQDSRGFNIHYLKSGDTVLEVFTYGSPTRTRVPQLTAPGFAAAVLSRTRVHTDAFTVVGEAAGRVVRADPDGFPTALVD